MKRLIFLIFPFLITFSCFSKEDPSFFTSLKNRIVNLSYEFLGEEFSDKIWGPSVKLPDIPHVVRVPTSLKTYEKKKKESRFDPKKMDYYNVLFLKEIYIVVRNEKISEGDLKKWINVLRQGGSREGIYHSLVLDNVYANLEMTNELVTEKVIQFCVNYMEKFMDKKISPETLKDANHFTLKRIFVERLIEVMEVLSYNEEDLNDWYAILSSDLAKEFSHVFKGKLRIQKEKLFHKKWAEKADEELIKSEVIIKVHRVFNYLISGSV